MHASPDRADTRPVVLIGLAVAFSLLGDVTIYTVVPIYHEALGLGPIEVGILLSANRWVRLLTNRWARALLERCRARVVLAVALACGAAVTFVYAAAPPFWVFLAARLAWGALWSLIRHAGVMTSIAAGTSGRAAGRLGVYNGTVQLGFIAGTLAGASLFDAYGFTTAFVVMGVVSAAGLAFDYLGFRRLLRDPPAARQAAPAGHARDAADLFRGFVTACVGVGLIVSTLGFLLRERFGSSVQVGPVVVGIATLNGILIALRYTIGSVGSPLLGRAIDRVGRRAAELATFTVACVALVVATAFPDAAVLFPAVVVFFIANVASWLSLASRAGLAGPASFSRLVTAADLGAAAGPLVGWLAIDRGGSPDAVFGIGAVLYAAAVLTTLVHGRAGRAAPA